MITLSGLRVNKDIRIEYTGLRPGEKLYEELFHKLEKLSKTSHQKLFRAHYRKINQDDFIKKFEILKMALKSAENHDYHYHLKLLVPEYKYNMERHDKHTEAAS